MITMYFVLMVFLHVFCQFVKFQIEFYILYDLKYAVTSVWLKDRCVCLLKHIPLACVHVHLCCGWHNVCRRLCWHNEYPDMSIQIFNISTKEQRKNKMSIIMWEASMSYATTFKQKNETLDPKRYIVTTSEPYFVVFFQITLVSQHHSSVLVNKIAHFMLMNSPSVHACAT